MLPAGPLMTVVAPVWWRAAAGVQPAPGDVQPAPGDVQLHGQPLLCCCLSCGGPGVGLGVCWEITMLSV